MRSISNGNSIVMWRARWIRESLWFINETIDILFDHANHHSILIKARKNDYSQTIGSFVFEWNFNETMREREGTHLKYSKSSIKLNVPNVMFHMRISFSISKPSVTHHCSTNYRDLTLVRSRSPTTERMLCLCVWSGEANVEPVAFTA